MTDFFIRSDGIKVDLIPEPYCKWCSKPIPRSYRDHGLCYECDKKSFIISEESKQPVRQVDERGIEWIPVRATIKINEPLLKVNAVGIYFLKTAENQLSKEIWELKRNPSIADKLGECMVYVINNRYQDLKKMDVVVPVPSGDSKRPYNQAALLAKYVSEHIGIPYKDILHKKEEFPPQHSVKLDQKESNVKGKIDCKEKITGQKVLLIDDTYITGDTKNECARALKECGAKEIRGLVVGRSVDKTHMEYIEKLNKSYEQ